MSSPSPLGGRNRILFPTLPRGEVVAAISASGPSFRLTRRRAEEIVPDLAGAAAELTAQLGR